MSESQISDVNSKIKELESFCLKDPVTGTLPIKSEKNALKCLQQIAKGTNRETLQEVAELVSLINCSLLLFQAGSFRNFQTSRSFLQKLMKKKTLRKIKLHFELLMSALIPEKIEVVFAVVEDFLANGNLWKAESVCCEIFQAILSSKAAPEVVLNELLDLIESLEATNDHNECRRVIRVLHSIINEENFSATTKTAVSRLLFMYHSIVLADDEKISLIRTGLECVLVRILRAVRKDLIKEILPSFLQLTFQTDLPRLENRDFGMTLSFAIKRLRSSQMGQDLQPEFVDYLLSAMVMKSDVKSFLATRYLSLVIDHFGNFESFSSPVIFHGFTNYDVKLGREDGATRSVIEEFRDHFESSIITTIKLHSHNRDNLNSIYTLLCVLIANIPNGHTIVFVVCILVNLQTFLLTDPSISETQANQLHALIASIFTLICWVTRAKSLTKYVHSIVNLRYDSARHLNPPIMDNYQTAINKSDFFFDSWHLRYCLWKRFRLDEELLPSVNPVKRPNARRLSPERQKYLHQRRVTFG